ncbi:tRNA synthetases class I (M)-domain-containing protein [Amylostereum chailletii]|nr:tRNA synthetases class I (M)-domain-containing protein [Amylostereum chailletii]
MVLLKLQSLTLASHALKRPFSPTTFVSTRTLSDFHSPQESYYVTTPIFYPNAAPHIGHLYTLVTSDILARHARLAHPDRPVRFLTGTDEHGFKIQRAAQDKGLDPLVFCDQLSERFRALARGTNISYTRFIRTTEPDHRDAVRHLWRALSAKDLIYKGTHQGWYSIPDECFYTDAQVSRKQTPNGEQVVAIETGSSVEWMQEENYKFRLSLFRDSLLARYRSDSATIHPAHQHANVLDMLSLPLEDLSISRPRSRLYWGIPVPDDPEHTMYVWFDALTNYLTGAGYPWTKSTDAAEVQFWPPDIQVVGKDIVRFHAIYFPAMLQALDLPLPRRLLAHSHWTVNKQKMSKSVGNVADPFQAMDEIGVDLVSEPIRDRLKEDFTSHIPDILEDLAKSLALKETVASLKVLSTVVDHELENLRVASALEAVVDQLKTTNALLNATKPWAKDTSDDIVEQVCALSLETLRICGILLQPFIPSKAGELLDALGVPSSTRTLRYARYSGGSTGRIQSGVKLFAQRSSGGKSL